ncbi:uncharacterized protein RSE6_00727 [Rhynchosporium secalis]|uniref:Uncharacterized protein n=1 Tax=Rhynchosporium secalis TaxID=38038 RepID=A0A1E1LW17_RHYSE|nr:uncharacterized protein RSE6_00727 [Rhynchosporium secalis]
MLFVVRTVCREEGSFGASTFEQAEGERERGQGGTSEKIDIATRKHGYRRKDSDETLADDE